MEPPETSSVAQDTSAAATMFGKYRMSELLFLGSVGLTALIHNGKF